jgi:hypothetical protein
MRARITVYALTLAVFICAGCSATQERDKPQVRRERPRSSLSYGDLAVFPAEPTQHDLITVTFSVSTMSNAIGAASTHRISGNVIVIDVALARPEVERGIRPGGGFQCTEMIGTLKPGKYTVAVQTPADVSIPGGKTRLEFTVSD